MCGPYQLYQTSIWHVHCPCMFQEVALTQVWVAAKMHDQC